MKFNYLTSIGGLSLCLALAACGGGSNPSAGSAGTDKNVLHATMVTSGAVKRTLMGEPSTALAGAELTPPVAPQPALTPAAASHFLAQASFGPTAETIATLTASTKADWITAQFLKPQSLHKAQLQKVATLLPAGTSLTQNNLFETFWTQAVTGDDQLRQRMAFALSQIFVISLVDNNVAGHAIGIGSYYDMLGQNAFGNFRDLLQSVALHPMMGIYLSHLRNQKESGDRSPDENFAREIMQLMTIGLYQLNQDGSLKLQSGKPVETYTHADVAGLARVFTGWSWAGPDRSFGRFIGYIADPNRDWTPMQSFPVYHSSSAKSFLGVTVGAGGSAESDLKIALDTLFQHPNVGPFIGRLLIQRLVSSNPSPAYVGRVAAAFANNGSGVRGDMRAVIRAVLLDPEADDNGSSKKLREPVLRLANWLRAFNAKSASGHYQIYTLDDSLEGLTQTPLRSPSVFNFYRPSYTPPGSSLAAQGMVAPEMQITSEPSVTGYLNFMQTTIPSGVGLNHEVSSDYSAELPLAGKPAMLLDRINLLLLNGTMSSTLRNQILVAVNSIPLPAANATNASQVAAASKNRVHVAIYLSMASPEYLAQR
ncbi:MAG: DUF1800 domain-containing protein [Pseudomonadota bacterium]